MAIDAAEEKSAEELIGLLAQLIPVLVATYKKVSANHSGKTYPPLEDLVAQGNAIFDGIKATSAVEIADAQARLANETPKPAEPPAVEPPPTT